MMTVGEIAARLEVAVHRIEYVVRAHNIPAVGRAGNARVFDDSALKRIKAALGSKASSAAQLQEAAHE
jgi:DNA-binding transcriptional MerR regulator